MTIGFKGISKKFWELVNKAIKHRVTTLVMLIGAYLVIFQTGLGGFLWHIAFPEPPINIVKARIENTPISEMNRYFDDSGKFFKSKNSS